MIRLLPILLLLLISAPACAFEMVGSSMPIALCSFSSSDADVLGESFEGAEAGYDNSGWSETEAGGSSIDPNASHSGTLSCTDKCVHAVAVVFDGSNATYTEKSHTAKSTAHTQVNLNVVSESLANSDSQILFSVRSGAGDGLIAVYLYQHTDGVLKLRLYYRNDSNAWTQFGTDSGAITAGNWYRVAITWVNGGTGRLYVDGTEIGSGFATCDSEDQTAVRLGSSAVTETVTFQIDNLKIDDDTLPGACP